jgi:hypothetical protein
MSKPVESASHDLAHPMVRDLEISGNLGHCLRGPRLQAEVASQNLSSSFPQLWQKAGDGSSIVGQKEPRAEVSWLGPMSPVHGFPTGNKLVRRLTHTGLFHQHGLREGNVV